MKNFFFTLVARPFVLAVFGAAALATGGCGIGVQRDLSSKNASEVVFDDACGLQEYFDAMKDSTIAPPTEVFSQDVAKTDRSGAVGGRVRYRFATDFQRHYLRRLLQANWRRLPEEIDRAKSIELEVRWAEKAGVRRVVTTEDALIWSGGKSWYLPYQVCLSDLLFGEPLYDTRRAFLNLPPPPPSPFAKKAPFEPAEPPGLPDAPPPVATPVPVATPSTVPAPAPPASEPASAPETTSAGPTTPADEAPATSATATTGETAPADEANTGADELTPPPQN